MIFESLWPLLFLAAIPIIIILYLLKPKGIDYLISSNLLWKKIIKNEQSKTFFEKFVNNILMYLQILVVVLLMIALMAPFINIEGKSGGRKILLIDTSASMQHKNASGKTRLEEAVEQACDYLKTVKNTGFSIVTAGGSEVELLAVDSTDTDSLVQILKQLECSDGGSSILEAQGLINTLLGEDADNQAGLKVYTDATGAEEFGGFVTVSEKELHVVGEATKNVANEYVVFTQRNDALYDVMVSMANYSDETVSFDVTLYDGEEVIGLSSMHLAASESKISLFEGVDWKGETLKAQLGGMTFVNGGTDSLEADNISYAVKTKSNLLHGLLIGDGNTFLEKAYLAVTGDNIVKSTTDSSAEGNEYNVVIYDAGHTPNEIEGNKLLFGNAKPGAIETLNNVVLDLTECDLTAGLEGFHIGVNKAYCFEPEPGAVSFLEYDGKCVGYYVEKEEGREVVVGFDIRESDFPLRAEFPVFLANAMIYLTDTSWLATNVYYAGEKIALQPWAEVLPGTYEEQTDKAGLYQIENEEYQEAYVVRFQTATESDGRKTADSIILSGELQLQKVKQTLRNLFIVLALVLLIIEWIIFVKQMRYKGKFYLIVRMTLLTCIVLALIGVQIRLRSQVTSTIFLVDLSNSNENNMNDIKEYLEENISRMPRGNAYGIVTFGKDSLVEQFVSTDKTYGGILTTPEKSATNFEEAFSKALTLIPQDAGGRLVVLTDGKETRGDLSRMTQAVTGRQIEVLSLIYENEEGNDAYIDNVNMPTYLHPGDKYSIDVVVESNYDTEANIVLYDGSKQIAANTVHLNKGSNHFVFSNRVDGALEREATENIQVKVSAQGDTCEENDFYSAFSVVEAKPKILIVSDRNKNLSAYEAVLQAAECEYVMLSALNAPDDINEMLDYKAIILADTYIDKLPIGFLNHLETYVKDYGCGFVCCGGEDSFALGGYRDTVLETVLPVDMMLRSVNEKPSMAMVMVIDHSGSMVGGMSPSNLDVAIKAATVAVDNLQDSDQVGVLTFDDQFTWQVELTKADNRSEINEKIKKIEAGGGTTIKPALHEAFEVISQSDASIKHVVLLTDGMGETNNYSDIIKEYSESGITLSTVAVGQGSDTKLLEYLAENCDGRYYYSDILSDIPKIFAQEVFLGGDYYIQNGNIPLSVRANHELTKGLFTEGWPLIYGYVASTPKTASNVVIASSDKNNPILTVWQYGLGRTIAWNSDITGEWSGDFSGKEDYAQLWKRIVDYATGNVNIGEDSVEVVTAGEYTEISYQTKEYDSNTEVMTTVIDPKGNTQDIKLYATAPGKYKAEIPTEQIGMYHFNIRRMEEDEIKNYLTTAATVQFSDEYKFDVSNASFLNFIQQCGRVITKEENIWTRLQTNAKGKILLTNYLLGMALILFMYDIAIRRFQYEPVWKWKKSGKKKKAEKETENASIQEPVTEQIVQENVEPKKQQIPKKKKEKDTSQQMLDTSQLLRKKDDRNI